MKVRSSCDQQTVTLGEFEIELCVYRTMIAMVCLDGVQPCLAKFRQRWNEICLYAHRVCQRCNASSLPYSLHSLNKLWFFAMNVSFGQLTKVFVECLLDVRNEPLLHHEFREMRSPGHSPAQSLNLLKRDIEPEFL